MATSAKWIFRVFMGVTALSMLTSIACGVYANRSFATPTPNPPNALLQINIPFNTLHVAIALGIVVTIVLNVLFNLEGVGGIFWSAVLLGFFSATEKQGDMLLCACGNLLTGSLLVGTTHLIPSSQLLL